MNIVEFLDEAFPADGPSLLPANPYARAAAFFKVACVDDKLLSGWLGTFDAAKPEAEKVAALAQMRAAVDALEGVLRECSALPRGKGRWFGGDTVGLVDVVLGGFVPVIRVSETTTGLRLVNLDRAPMLAMWVERFCALEEAKVAMPPLERLVEPVERRV